MVRRRNKVLHEMSVWGTVLASSCCSVFPLWRHLKFMYLASPGHSIELTQWKFIDGFVCLSLTFILSVPTTIGCFSGKEDFLLEALYLYFYVVYTGCRYLGGLCRPVCACVLVSKKKEELSDFVMKVLTTDKIFLSVEPLLFRTSSWSLVHVYKWPIWFRVAIFRIPETNWRIYLR